jgi:hypothetical protein
MLKCTSVLRTRYASVPEEDACAMCQIVA